MDDGRTEEEAAKDSTRQVVEALTQPEHILLAQTPNTRQAVTPDRYIILSEDGTLTSSSDTEEELLDYLADTNQVQYLYQRIATARPRTGADIIKED